MDIKGEKGFFGNPDWDPATSMTLVSRFCHMSSVRSTSDGRGPVTRKRVPDREEPGKPRKDARRGRCHPLEAGFWPLWMTPLPRKNAAQAQAQVGGGFRSRELLPGQTAADRPDLVPRVFKLDALLTDLWATVFSDTCGREFTRCVYLSISASRACPDPVRATR